ncbi:N-acetyltransferase GNAT family [Penicillium longicatenatum]|uniref:N-acetyltransferase GNAT family n=1 Tax=Penicillium longicatenatum TaxID=1561947 RepID=UPI00254796B4|nr:N-acetyltransferase GNAT family [Penicillium longicatenatum]KAJ5649850.1 N-acetyltransferase GNAT family [Penicillium longicatenatum]
MEDELLPRQPVYALVPSSGPSIESNRLLLRPVKDRDTTALFAVRARPEVAKTNYPKTPFQSIEQTKEWLSSKIFKAPASVIGRSFVYSIVDKSIPDTEEQVIGYMGINAVDPCPEIGYSLLPESWGKGFATESLRMMLKMWWDLPRMELDDLDRSSGFVEKIYAICERDNLGSCAVLRKCGFEIVKEVEFGTDKLYLWSLDKPESGSRVVGASVEYRYVKN